MFNYNNGNGVDDHPDHFDEIFDGVEASGEKAELRESIRSWDADGRFVLMRRNECSLDSISEAVSS